jgi:hypothetical protein
MCVIMRKAYASLARGFWGTKRKEHGFDDDVFWKGEKANMKHTTSAFGKRAVENVGQERSNGTSEVFYICGQTALSYFLRNSHSRLAFEIPFSRCHRF